MAAIGSKVQPYSCKVGPMEAGRKAGWLGWKEA